VPTATTTNPSLGFNLPYAIPGYTYNITIIFAPDTEAEADSLAKSNKVNMSFFGSDNNGNIPTRGENIINPEDNTRNFVFDNALKCDTATIAREVSSMQNCIIQVASKVSSKENNKYSREIRIADIIMERKKIKSE
jgi:hypothetical protein